MVSFKSVGRRLLEWKTDQLTLALQEGDVQEIEYLRKKKEGYLASVLLNDDMAGVTPEIAGLFINKFTDADWQRWGFKPDSRDAILRGIMGKAMLAGREELFGLFMESGLEMNAGHRSIHPINYILTSKIDKEKAAGFIGQLVARGIDNVAEAKQFPETALLTGAPRAFDILVRATGVDIHANNEEYLRKAALAGDTKMARHLAEHHAADIAVAITTERTLGHDSSWKLLEAVRLEMDPSAKASAPPTIESLSSEISLLKQTVRELTQRVESLQPPVLAKPSVLKIGGPS